MTKIVLNEITDEVDDDYKWKIFQVDVCPVNVSCGSYGDKFEHYSDDGKYVHVEEHISVCKIYEEEIERLKKCLQAFS